MRRPRALAWRLRSAESVGQHPAQFLVHVPRRSRRGAEHSEQPDAPRSLAPALPSLLDTPAMALHVRLLHRARWRQRPGRAPPRPDYASLCSSEACPCRTQQTGMRWLSSAGRPSRALPALRPFPRGEATVGRHAKQSGRPPMLAARISPPPVALLRPALRRSPLWLAAPDTLRPPARRPRPACSTASGMRTMNAPRQPGARLGRRMPDCARARQSSSNAGRQPRWQMGMPRRPPGSLPPPGGRPGSAAAITCTSRVLQRAVKDAVLPAGLAKHGDAATRSGTRSRPTCWRMATTSAPFRSSSATATSPRR